MGLDCDWFGLFSGLDVNVCFAVGVYLYYFMLLFWVGLGLVVCFVCGFC